MLSPDRHTHRGPVSAEFVQPWFLHRPHLRLGKRLRLTSLLQAGLPRPNHRAQRFPRRPRCPACPQELTVKWLPMRHPGEAGHRKRNLELPSAAKNYVLKSCYKPKCRERRGRLGSPGQEVARGREQTGTRGEARLPAPGPRPRAQALFCLSSLTCKMGRRWPLQRRRCPKAMPRVWP